jgi:hypothetical protein
MTGPPLLLETEITGTAPAGTRWSSILGFLYVSYLSFRPSVPFPSDSSTLSLWLVLSFLSVSVLFLHTRLLADLCT